METKIFDFNEFFDSYCTIEDEWESTAKLVEFKKIFASLSAEEQNIIKKQQELRAKILIQRANELLGEKAIA